MTVALVETATVDLREPAKPFELKQFAGALQLCEVLFDPSIWKSREFIDAEPVDRGRSPFNVQIRTYVRKCGRRV
jgi:hypothetical protein